MFSKKILRFFPIILILIICMGVVSSAENVTVENLSAVNDTTQTFDDVENTIENGEINSTVILNGTYEGSGKEITINKDITIDGLGTTTLNANHKSGIFSINASNVIIKNINFINAKSPNNGGAVTSNGKLTIIDCNFINNTVDNGHEYHQLMEDFYYAMEYTGNGGAVNANNDLTVINSTFINNSAHIRAYYRDMDVISHSDEGNGGAINCLGNLHIEGSRFIRNSASSIETYNNTEIINCNFENQSSAISIEKAVNVSFAKSSFNDGGAIISYYVNVNLTINDCNFTDGKDILIDIYSDDSNVIINNSRFVNNNIYDNLYDESLIGVWGYAKIINSTFINNTVRNRAVLELEKYDLKDCIFINNKDATIFAKNKMLDDSLNRIYIFEPVMKKKISKTYYDSGDKIRVDVINVNTKETRMTYDIKIYINGKYHDDVKLRKQFIYTDYTAVSDYLIFPVSKWNAGTYNVVIKHDNKYTKDLEFKITVQKSKATVKAPKVTNKYKKSAYFKVTVKNKATKKAAKKLILKLKIGKKTYKVKTNKKGIAKFNTKNLKVGTYKVKITSGNANYKISAKSTIKIKW